MVKEAKKKERKGKSLIVRKYMVFHISLWFFTFIAWSYATCFLSCLSYFHILYIYTSSTSRQLYLSDGSRSRFIWKRSPVVRSPQNKEGHKAGCCCCGWLPPPAPSHDRARKHRLGVVLLVVVVGREGPRGAILPAGSSKARPFAKSNIRTTPAGVTVRQSVCSTGSSTKPVLARVGDKDGGGGKS